jgi:hypothetical protein
MIEAENAYLGLRTAEGLALPADGGEIASVWAEQGWANVLNGRVALTPEGWLRLDALAAALTSGTSR